MSVLKETTLIFKKKCICHTALKAGWPRTCNPLASASNVLGLQVWATTPILSILKYLKSYNPHSFSPISQSSEHFHSHIFNTHTYYVFKGILYVFLLASELAQQLPHLPPTQGSKLVLSKLNSHCAAHSNALGYSVRTRSFLHRSISPNSPTVSILTWWTPWSLNLSVLCFESPMTFFLSSLCLNF